MNEKIVFIGVDVDDKNFHAAFISNDQSVSGRFKTKPSVGALVNKIKEVRFDGYEIRICYEATYLGFSLWRDLKKQGYKCAVISPSLIPKVVGRTQKTDRIDAEKLAEYYSKGLITSVYVPSEEDEGARALIRAREGVSKQIRSVKRQILGLCRLNGFHYRETTIQSYKYANHWTVRHLKWLDSMIKAIENPNLKMTFNLLFMNLNQLEEILAKFDGEFENISQSEVYKSRVEALRAFRGIDTLGALTLVLEIADVKRFNHPKRLASFAGFDIREYSSGGRENKFGISNMGNKFIRTRTIEACQSVFLPPKVSIHLQERRAQVDGKIVAIADKCMLRLHTKAYRMIHSGKNRNVIKAACAREMLCFVWEALRAVA